jgi:hypothetical protein
MIQSPDRVIGAAAKAFGIALLAGTAALVSHGDAAAQTSAYSSTAPKHCRVLSTNNEVDDSTTRVCPGRNGLVVLINEDDLRESVSVGRNRKAAEDEPAARTSFGPFNSSTETVEWRLDAKTRPIAIIQRWHIADNDDPAPNGRPRSKQLLVVTRLPPGAVCHIAYVDVKANPTANELARKAADDIARDFACGKDEPKVIGASGRAVELAQPH